MQSTVILASEFRSVASLPTWNVQSWKSKYRRCSSSSSYILAAGLTELVVAVYAISGTV